jgi:hypothetical protein
MNIPGLLLFGFLLVFCAPGHTGMIFNVTIIEDGNYRLAFEELGPLKNPVASETLRWVTQSEEDNFGYDIFRVPAKVGFDIVSR